MDWTVHMRRVLTLLGEDVAYSTGTGAPATVRGVFLTQFLAQQLGLPSVTGSNPQFAYMTADISGSPVGGSIVRGAVTYTVKVKQPDDPSGITVLELRKAS